VWSAVERSPFFHQRARMLARHAGEVEADCSTTETQLHSWFNAGASTRSTWYFPHCRRMCPDI
jgi:hypothetical protein